MKTLKLFLALTLVAFLSSSFTVKTQQTASNIGATVYDIYKLGSIELEIPEPNEPPLLLPVDLYGYNYYGTVYVTYAEHSMHHTLMSASGTVSWIGGVWTANVIVDGYPYYGPL